MKGLVYILVVEVLTLSQHGLKLFRSIDGEIFDPGKPNENVCGFVARLADCDWSTFEFIGIIYLTVLALQSLSHTRKVSSLAYRRLDNCKNTREQCEGCPGQTWNGLQFGLCSIPFQGYGVY